MWKKKLFIIGLLVVLVFPIVRPQNFVVFSIKAESSADETSEFEENSTIENDKLFEAIDDSVIEESEEEKIDKMENQENIVGLAAEGFIFSFNGTAENSEATVIGYNGEIPSHLVIPSETQNSDANWSNSTPITAIGDRAFSNISSTVGSITSVKLPETIKTIGKRAFFQQYNLTSIEMNEGLEVIEDFAFMGSILEEISLPENLLTIGDQAFPNTLRKLSIPESTIYYGNKVLHADQLEVIEVRTVDPLSVIDITTVKDSLSENVFTDSLDGKPNTILRTEKPIYAVETDSENNVASGSNKTFEISPEYQLSPDFKWIAHSLEHIQWFKDGVALENETASKLELKNVQSSDSGIYHVEVSENRYPDINLDVGAFSFIFLGEDGNSTALVNGYEGIFPSDIIIPSEAINEAKGWSQSTPVIGINNDAFSNFDSEENRILTSVTFPDTLSQLFRNAFANQTDLVEVIGSKYVRNIGEGAFMNTGLKNFEFASGVAIGANAFNSANLQEVRLGDGGVNLYTGSFANNKELTNVYLNEYSQFRGNGVFSGSPLEQILVTSQASQNSVDLYSTRSSLTIDVMTGVTTQPILRSDLDGMYQGGTVSSNQNVREGGSFSLQVSERLQLSNTNFAWVMVPRDSISWFKDGVEMEGKVTNSLSLTDLKESDSAVYHAVAEGIEYAKIQLNVTLNPSPPIPAIDPTLPNIDPENSNPTISSLSLRYVSSLDFGRNTVSSRAETFYSRLLEDKKGQMYAPMIVVQDQRTQGNRTGWELRVSLGDEFMNGAEIIMNPFIHEEYKRNLKVETVGEEFIVNTSPQSFAGTTMTANPSGIVPIGMSNPEGLGVELRIPSGLGVGSYSTTLNWELVVGP